MSATSTDDSGSTASWVGSPGAFLAPLALAQFICSFAGSNMNVMINDISHDLHTDVKGVQTTITLFLVIMAVLMIPCSKLTDRFGRKRCFIGGLVLYGIGTVLSAVAPGLGVLILGNSVFQGVGTAFLIPPVYILTTMAFTSIESRAKAFGVISGLGGIGAAAGPLIGGLITSAISWRAAFVFQALVVATIIVLARRVVDPVPPDSTRSFDTVGAILSAVGMFCLVVGILQAGVNNTLLVVFLVVGAAFLAGFFVFTRSRERAGKEPLLSPDLFKNRTSNLGLITQNLQWLLLMGVSFTVSVFLQTERHYSAIEDEDHVAVVWRWHSLAYGRPPGAGEACSGERQVPNYRYALPAMARYLCASGAGQDLRKAIYAYNHADWYVTEVLQLAARYGGIGAAGSGLIDGWADRPPLNQYDRRNYRSEQSWIVWRGADCSAAALDWLLGAYGQPVSSLDDALALIGPGTGISPSAGLLDARGLALAHAHLALVGLTPRTPGQRPLASIADLKAWLDRGPLLLDGRAGSATATGSWPSATTLTASTPETRVAGTRAISHGRACTGKLDSAAGWLEWGHEPTTSTSIRQSAHRGFYG